MTFQTGVTEFAEFLGTEIKRIEKKIPTDGGGSQSSDPMIITGEGRPDNQSTTGGKITGSEPSGTIYISKNGGGVGAYMWQKQNNKWVVVSADTGDINLPAKNVRAGNWVKIHRTNNQVYMSFGGGQWGWFQLLGKGSKGFIQRKARTKNIDLIGVNGIPQGFRADFSLIKPFYDDNGVEVGKVYVGSKNDANFIEIRFLEEIRDSDYTDLRFPDLTWFTSDPYPTSL